MRYLSFLLLIGSLLYSTALEAQYFGRNKPRYQKHDFQVHETEHFRIYDYLKNPEKLRELAAAAELWYHMHQAVLKDSFVEKNPIIIYSDHAGFQQTNTIMGDISVGTGGVTEGLRNRVVFPVALTNQQTHHVLGHELVHAFQYKLILDGDSTTMRDLGNLPLWMVEGLAEYLSVGRIDPHTAMWMRDAVKHGTLPKNFRDLEVGNFFPYRWGQAFWAFVTGLYGDEAIHPLFVYTARLGLEGAVPLVLGTTADSLAAAWIRLLRSYYGQWTSKGKKERFPGKRLLSDENFGSMNISPSISPNGKYFTFLSERNLFSVELYLADARNGKVLRKVASTAQDGHIDQFDFIESAGTWAPDGERFAFDVYEQGRSVLLVKDVFSGKTLDRITIPGVPEFSHAAWSPDGRTIVVSGLVNGQTDLYAYDLRTKRVRRLTNDRYSEIHPVWSRDGSLLAFATDQLSMERGRTNGAWRMNLALMDVANGYTEMLDIFPAADNLNPQFDAQGNLYFLSNRDGMRNLYYYDRTTKKVFQVTELETGISGITPYAPAIAIGGDRLLYTLYNEGKYEIYQVRTDDLEKKVVSADAVDLSPAALPPFFPTKRDVVNTNLRLMDARLREMLDTFTLRKMPYRAQFSLSYIGGGGGIGVTTGNTSFGAATGLAGGVDMLFDDILGNNQLYVGLAVNGEIQDAAGIFSYINNKSRWSWGGAFSHIPFQSIAYYGLRQTQIETRPGVTINALEEVLGVQRLFQERLSAFLMYPFSVTRRIEFGGAFEFYSTRLTEYSTFYDLATYLAIGSRRQRIPGSSQLSLFNANAALVGDNSFFGFTAPLQGWRYRVGLEQFFGDFNFTTVLIDGRRYFRLRPFTLAVRSLSYGRFGGNSDRVFPFFLGNPWFVRGYGSDELYTADPRLAERMIGNKVSVANIELRLPFLGRKPLSLVNFFLPIDLGLFADGGVAMFNFSDLERPSSRTGQVHQPIYSVGTSIRVNLFGALILEPYYALPLSVKSEVRQWRWGFNLLPGW
ncbi:MAG: hypothetical protein NZM43_07395 [Saprospiraceae bacterium]|nr:hypothetical protein [Saprospiraceae bacterium]MDW8484132.1 hypothetical protein [Saprospiraceae bacterium]